MKYHYSLRSYVDSPEALYALLLRLQARSTSMVGYRALLMVGLLAAGIAVPGPWGSLALCFAAVAAIACIFAMADYVARDWFMHALTLHELIRPRVEAAELFMPDLGGDTDGQA
jgi:hypothetical protein